MSVVTFDYGAWSLQFPTLAARVSAPVAAMRFTQATMYLNNTDCSPVQDINVRTMLLYLLTAHIAALRLRADDAGSVTGIVGRINSAAEGSVNVQLELQGDLHARAWYAQTQYGLDYWEMTAQNRTARYRPGPVFTPDPFARIIFRR